MAVNQVNLVGYLGRDPEVRYTAGGEPVATVRLATSESWKDKSTGERTQRTEWHTVVAFGKLAEIMGEYPKKGALVWVSGKLQTRKWQDKDGNDRYSTEVVANQLRMLGGKGENESAPAPSPAPSPAPAPRRTEPLSIEDLDDDIPF